MEYELSPEDYEDVNQVNKAVKLSDLEKIIPQAYAKAWLRSTSRKNTEAMAESDEHSPSILRVNSVLCNFQEFYDTYGIKEGDGMYVPPEERIQIW